MPKEILKYKLKIYVNEKRIYTKPWILNTFGNVLYSFLSELKDYEETKKGIIEIKPSEDEGQKVKLIQLDKQIQVKNFVQELIMKTLLGYLSTLSGIPKDLLNSDIKIEFKSK